MGGTGWTARGCGGIEVAARSARVACGAMRAGGGRRDARGWRAARIMPVAAGSHPSSRCSSNPMASKDIAKGGDHAASVAGIAPEAPKAAITFDSTK